MNDAHARTEGGSGVDSKLKTVRPGQKIAFPFGWFSSVRGAPFCRLFGKLIAEGMPNANGKLEGTFMDLKKNLNNHSGMNEENRKRFIFICVFSWH